MTWCYCPECGDAFEFGVYRLANPSIKFCSKACMDEFYKAVPCALVVSHAAHENCPGIPVEAKDG